MLRWKTLLRLIHTIDYPINLHFMQHSPLTKAQAGTTRNLKYWLFGAAVVLTSLIVVSGTRAAAPLWDISGAWTMDFTFTSPALGTYSHSFNVDTFDTGTGVFSGTGSYNASPAYTWDIDGTVDGDTIDYTLVYTGLSAGYTITGTGTIALDGLSMGGSFSDSLVRSGTWASVGTATPIIQNLKVDDDGIECPDASFTSIQDAINVASDGDTVEVCPGTYVETMTFASPDNLTVEGVAGPKPVVDGGVKFANASDMTGLTLRNLYFKGAGGTIGGSKTTIFHFANSGGVLDLTLDDVVLDGEDDPDRYGIYGGRLGGDLTVMNSEFKNIRYWALLDTNAGGGTPLMGENDLPFTSITFAENHIHDSDASVALRGASGSKTPLVNVYGNTWEDIGSASLTDFHWAAMELNHAQTVNIYDNTVTGVDFGEYGEGQAFQLWDVDTLDMHDNAIHDNAQGVFIYGGDGSPSGFGGFYAVPGGSVHDNDFVNNGDFGVSVAPAAVGGPLDAQNNWWGSCTGPTHASNPGGTGDVVSDNVDFDPWTSCITDVSGMKFKDVNGNGINDGDPETGLEGWTIVAAELFDSFPVDSNDTVGMTSGTLTNGEIYLVRVEGTYDAGDAIMADAKYSVRAPNTYWTDSVQNYTSYGPELLDLQVDGASPDWGPYNAGHIYWLNVLGSGAGLTFKINDIGYPNSGALSVGIYHVISQTLTDVDGLYSLTGIPSGNFIVAEIPQTGWLQTLPTPEGYYAVTTAGAYTNYDFGNWEAPSIRGMKFDDLNGNGVKEPIEPGIEGWRIRLRDLTTNLVSPMDTDVDGNYAFESLPPGQYRVSEKQETGWTQTMPVSPATYLITLVQGQQEVDKDFGNFEHFGIQGIKYEDVDGSGEYEAGEPLLENWEIVLDGPAGSQSAFTDALGAYAFVDLGPGAYTLSEVNQDAAEWGQSQPGGDGTNVIEGESGAVFTEMNFGNYRFAAIKGRKYRDDNFNGVRNTGDPFLGGWTIELISLRDGSRQTAVTKANNPNKGSYAFTNLRPGSHIVRELLKPGWLPINPSNTIHRVTVLSDQELTDVDFGNNTFRNYAVWRITHPSAFVSPLTIEGDTAIVPPLEITPQENTAAAPPAIALPVIVPPVPPELPNVLLGPPVSANEIVRKVFESIQRWLPRER